MLFNALTLEPLREVQDRLDNKSRGVKKSAFPHTGQYLATACDDLISQIETSSWQSTARHVGAPTPAPQQLRGQEHQERGVYHQQQETCCCLR